MQRFFVLIGFDCEGNKIKNDDFATEKEAYEFAENHGIEILSIKAEWFGVSI